MKKDGFFFFSYWLDLGATTKFQKSVSVKDVGQVLFYIHNILLRGEKIVRQCVDVIALF